MSLSDPLRAHRCYYAAVGGLLSSARLLRNSRTTDSLRPGAACALWWGRRAQAHRWYSTAVGGGAIGIAIAGFAPSLLDGSARLGPVSPLVLVHALIATSWLLLFVLQGTLVATGRAAMHRRLGVASTGLAVLVILTGYSTVMEQTRRGYDLSGDLNVRADPKLAAVFPLGDLVSFTVLFAAGLWRRKQPEAHQRLMTLATLGGFMPAAVAHLVGHQFRSLPLLVVPLIGIIFFAPAVYDRMRSGRFHPITLWGGLSLFAWGNVRAGLIGPSEAWHNLMGWLVG